MRFLFAIIIGCFVGWNTPFPDAAKSFQSSTYKIIMELMLGKERARIQMEQNKSPASTTLNGA